MEGTDHGSDVTCHAVPVAMFLVFRNKINVPLARNNLEVYFLY